MSKIITCYGDFGKVRNNWYAHDIFFDGKIIEGGM
jgi:hypothetical protein